MINSPLEELNLLLVCLKEISPDESEFLCKLLPVTKQFVAECMVLNMKILQHLATDRKDDNVPCAVCYTSACGAKNMIPGKVNCTSI